MIFWLCSTVLPYAQEPPVTLPVIGLGPLLGGFLISAGLALNLIFYVLAGLALLGLFLTLLVPVRRPRELRSTFIEPTPSMARSTEPARTP